MKNIFNYKQLPGLFAFVIIALVFYGCEKNDQDTQYGITNIYLTQSTTSGGTNLNYLVPSGRDTTTFNYSIDTKNKKVNVLLGVMRSGKQISDGYTVTVSTRADTIAQLISNGLIKVNPNPTKTVVQLPATAYTLPASITVPSGQYQGSFNLSIDITTLKTYAGQKVALCVVLSNATAYTLSSTNKQVIIIIDVDSLKLP